ncbi:MAG: GDP-mannose 4,6-dehydratase [Chlamydiales bacterium]|nr:GDP-mannose 4,6-dehydratase [Chlamydiales bacterium]
MPKRALITGITGQDGAYLARFLLQKGYSVHGLQRRASTLNTTRIDSILTEYQESCLFHLHEGDLSDGPALNQIIKSVEPDEIYNLGAQSHVATSFELPEYTANVSGLGTLRLLEACRLLGLEKKTRFYQASTSELFGKVQEVPQRETTPFYPRSPYAIAKLFAYWTTINYRESYGMYACNGILFNHESPFRGDNFVTRKITRGLSRVLHGIQKCLYMGNLDAKRDWGHAKDYVEMQWMMLQQDKAEDFVIATGVQHSVRKFIELALAEVGIELDFDGTGVSEVGIVRKVPKEYSVHVKEGAVIVAVDSKHFRPAEVDTLLGDASFAYQKLGWKPKISFEELVKEMMHHDMKLASLHKIDFNFLHQMPENIVEGVKKMFAPQVYEKLELPS